MSQEAEILAHLQKGHDIHNTPITANGKRFACYWMKVEKINKRGV